MTSTKFTHDEIASFAKHNQEAILEIVQGSMFGLENDGLCLSCGEVSSPHEPDAENQECECCGTNAVFGGETLLMYL